MLVSDLTKFLPLLAFPQRLVKEADLALSSIEKFRIRAREKRPGGEKHGRPRGGHGRPLGALWAPGDIECKLERGRRLSPDDTAAAVLSKRASRRERVSRGLK